ncbi:leucine-rich repeat domain-containing protein [Leptospira gomenensis]|uniref:Leucine-rich repeat domain-containing protein n=1 Tax=Leptospira gomenensis TaxID=2484974 RepID=A0A5F1Y6U9_9LEPT|nr:leucine-rich repeat domain-containing protein [Leptospira gomenensis]TGK28958.1 leucine-rich repeat domain-containing protein [Leptospira gomenensis]TGK35419.1 leucine-rich repeat domain-containing protein [Leptospira gomenensis]TGK40717.1 leucine-rich repeat domain-containing protein [Leptospira gomenensis]TGK68439.1 leucine-rich repeat domain-containing protein [Leptospira gomenensis]
MEISLRKQTFVFAAITACAVFFSSCKKNAEEILKDAEASPETVTVLDLGMQKLTSTPNGICSFPNLSRLDLRLNSLSSLAETIGDCKNLEQINLFGNDLSAFPSSFSKLKRLRVILMGSNDFKTFPSEFLFLPEIRTIYADQNQLSLTETDVEILASLTGLEELDLNLNRNIKSLPSNYTKLKNLTRLKRLNIKKTSLRGEDADKLQAILPKTKIDY